MDWQQIVALGVVLTTLAVVAARPLLRRVRRSRRPGQPPAGCGCGCSAALPDRRSVSITYRQIKGRRPELVVRTSDATPGADNARPTASPARPSTPR